MADESSVPARAYDADAIKQPHDQESATIALVGWVELAYKLLATTDPESIHRLGQHWLGKQRYLLDEPLKDQLEWKELEYHVLLQRWIYAASRDRLIQKVYGVSNTVGDAAWASLQTEAHDFLNWALATHSFSESSAYPSAVNFWNDLAAGRESYEFGEIIYSLKLDASAASISIGQGMRLQRLSKEWCAERFEFDEEPTNDQIKTRWAIVISQHRARVPRRTTYWMQENESDQIQAALLALRLVRFASFFTSARYRVGNKGWYQPQVRGLAFPHFWREEDSTFAG